MKTSKRYFTGVIISFIMAINVFSQAPPVTKVGEAYVSSGTYYVPIIVTGFTQVGDISLKLKYDATKLEYSGVTLNSGLPANTLTSPLTDQSGVFKLSCTSATSIVLGSPVTTLLTISYTPKPGTNGVLIPLTWSTSQGACDMTPPAPGTFVPQIDGSNFADFFVNGSISIPHLSPVTLDLSLYLEGLYSGNNLMNQAQGTSGNQFMGNTADVILVELHDAVSYQTLVYSADNINLSNTGLAEILVPAIYTGSYYLTVKHRNSLKTVSSVPISFSTGNVSYSFKTQASQAYGNNLKNVGGIFAIYTGDVNQDDIVDLSDLISVGFQAAHANSGYINEDINGDGLVDLTDLLMTENNAAEADSTRTPY